MSILLLLPTNHDALDARDVRENKKQECVFCAKAIPPQVAKCHYCGSVIDLEMNNLLTNMIVKRSKKDGIRQNE